MVTALNVFLKFESPKSRQIKRSRVNSVYLACSLIIKRSLQNETFKRSLPSMITLIEDLKDGIEWDFLMGQWLHLTCTAESRGLIPNQEPRSHMLWGRLGGGEILRHSTCHRVGQCLPKLAENFKTKMEEEPLESTEGQ